MASGIECPFCGSPRTKVTDCRADVERGTVKRRRECDECHERWYTFEIEEDRLDLFEDALRRGPI